MALTLETKLIFISHYLFWHLIKKVLIILILRCSVVFLSI